MVPEMNQWILSQGGICRFLWCVKIWVISDHWSWSGSSNGMFPQSQCKSRKPLTCTTITGANKPHSFPTPCVIKWNVWLRTNSKKHVVLFQGQAHCFVWIFQCHGTFLQDTQGNKLFIKKENMPRNWEDISHEIMYNNFETSLVVFMPISLKIMLLPIEILS